MAWIAITIDTLKEAKVSALIDAANTVALADGQPNRVPGIIQGVVDSVRRKVASNRRNLVDADLTTIPKGLRDLTVDLIIARLKKAIEQPLTEDEVRSVTTAERDLNRIASGDDVVDQPDTPIIAPVEGGPAVQLLTRRPNPFRDLGNT